VVISDDQELAAIKTCMAPGDGSFMFVDGFDAINKGAWKTEADDGLTYSNVNENGGRLENCLRLSASGVDDCSCTGTLYTLCEK